MHAPALETLKGINFVLATSLVLYVVLRVLTLRVNAEGRRKNAERGMAPVQPAVSSLF